MSSVTSTDSTFRPWHLFLVLSMASATAAVLVARETTPENLVLISLTAIAAGLAGMAVHRTLWPLVSDEPLTRATVVQGRARAALEREKALVLRSIKELEFDRAMGKVAQADFEEMVARLRARAIGLMKQLDEDRSGYRSAIEQELEARLKAANLAAVAGVPAVLPGMSCPECGTANDVDARFCKSCGTRLTGGH